jgi:hypothetical protein
MALEDGVSAAPMPIAATPVMIAPVPSATRIALVMLPPGSLFRGATKARPFALAMIGSEAWRVCRKS